MRTKVLRCRENGENDEDERTALLPYYDEE
jgi:hypothetical protein